MPGASRYAHALFGCIDWKNYIDASFRCIYWKIIWVYHSGVLFMRNIFRCIIFILFAQIDFQSLYKKITKYAGRIAMRPYIIRVFCWKIILVHHSGALFIENPLWILIFIHGINKSRNMPGACNAPLHHS
jgi:hypothetical protein